MSPAASLYAQDLSVTQLIYAVTLIAAALGLSRWLRLGLTKDLWIASLRTTVQLIGIGYLLRWVLGSDSAWVSFTALFVMTIAAAQAVSARTKNKSLRHFATALGAILMSVWPLGFLSLTLLFPGPAASRAEFFIPFMGVLLGNTLSAVSLSFLGADRVRKENLHEIESFRALGATSFEACQRLYRDILRHALTPILNGMTVVGLVSLPGVMAGQLLGGVDPLAAARIQVLLMFLILLTSMIGALLTVATSHMFFMPRWLTRPSSPLALAPHLKAKTGSPFALMGPSGGGKSRFLKSLAGLDEPCLAAGVLNRSPLQGVEWKMEAEAAWYVHQRPVFIPGTVEENLRWPFQFRTHSGKSYDGAIVQRLLTDLGLSPDILDSPATTLSGGESQLIHLIRVLQLQPNILYLDEPTASLDAERTSRVETRLLRWMQERDDRHLLFVTHSLEQSRRLRARNLFLRQGELSYESNSTLSLMGALASALPSLDDHDTGAGSGTSADTNQLDSVRSAHDASRGVGNQNVP